MEELRGCRAGVRTLEQGPGLAAWPEDRFVRTIRRGPRFEAAEASKLGEIWDSLPYFLLVSLIWGLALYLAAASLQ